MSHGRGSARERGIDASVLMDKEGEADLCCGRREREKVERELNFRLCGGIIYVG